MPVYMNLEADYAALKIGSRIRDARKRRGWTLAGLASELSVSPATLSAIENDKVTLDVELFLAAARVLGTTQEALLPAGMTQHFHVTRRDALEVHPAAPMDLVTRTRGSHLPYRHHLWSLAQPFVGRHIEPVAIEVEPTSDDNLWFISHNDEEFFFVLHGTIECLIKTPEGLTKRRVSSGDSMYFWSYLPHCIRSTGPEPARGIHVLYSAHQPADSELVHDHHGRTFYLLDGSHHTVIDQIARRIASLREAHGMSVADLAAAVNMSPRRVKAIERGDGPISLQLVLNMCRVFRRPCEFFLATTVPEPPYSFVLQARQLRGQSPQRSLDPPVLQNVFPGSRLKLLAKGFSRRSMNPYLVILDWRRPSPVPPGRYQGQAFVYVLDGALKFRTWREEEHFEETLFPGDSCFLDASFPHQFIRADFHPMEKRDAKILAVLWRPAGGVPSSAGNPSRPS